ncbi:anoctamin-1-like [Petromyzon marinus]|uniref:anoctamin-1-like n=1 Tax=Petromyzon marinus TaxID=7757 RepID=UPI003F710CFE
MPSASAVPKPEEASNDGKEEETPGLKDNSTGVGMKNQDNSLLMVPPMIALETVADSIQESDKDKDIHRTFYTGLQVLNNFVSDVMDIPKGGPYMRDGKRRVDFVLAYHFKRHRSFPGSPTSEENTATTLEVITAPAEKLETEDELTKRTRSRKTSVLEEGREMGLSSHHLLEKEQMICREEFEQNLMDARLELEWDEEDQAEGHGYLRIHAPWLVLIREAEFLKIKMPTKKVFEMKQSSGVLHGLGARINHALQPNVPHSQEALSQKKLSFPFSRDKQKLFDIKSEDSFFDSATRSRIVFEILKRVKCTKGPYKMGITSLIANGVYTSAFPLHDGELHGSEVNDRKLLHDEWASYNKFYKYQPLELIKKYFGEKIGLYFAWLGVYTQMLIPPSVVGIAVFLYGWLAAEKDIPGFETCVIGQNITMCPTCDKLCKYKRLSENCDRVRSSHLFDNITTVLFSIFMALWATTFLEHWKRIETRLNYTWDLNGMEESEQQLRPEYEAKLLEKKRKVDIKLAKTQKLQEPSKDSHNNRWKNKAETIMTGSRMTEEYGLSWRDQLPSFLINCSCILFMVLLSFAIVVGMIFYRITMNVLLANSTDPYLKSNRSAIIMATAFLINLVIILILDEIYGSIARWLTVIEVPKTEEEFETRLIFKSFMLKFVNSYTSIIYVAFLKGRITGYPKKYYYILPNYRMEECAPGGCLQELALQLCIIMLGKQLLQNNLFEVGIPKIKKLCRYLHKKDHHKKASHLKEEDGMELGCKDYELEPFTGLNPEYMEMVIQFGFVTLFVASFPLAPFFALLNNVIEIRLDGKKFVTELRRPTAVRAKDIGTWYVILNGVAKLAVIINALVIALTSDFVPRLIYMYFYSPDGSLRGYVNYTLSYFNVSDYAPGIIIESNYTLCRFRDYLEPPWSDHPYQYTKTYWIILAGRLAFVIIFQNLVMFLSNMLDWIIEDIPSDIEDCMKKEKLYLVNVFLKEEQDKMQLLESLIGKNKDNCKSSSSTRSSVRQLQEVQQKERSNSHKSLHGFQLSKRISKE